MLGFRKKVMPVQTYGSPVLKTLAAPVAAISTAIMDLAEQMIETMFAFDGIGLAAPQVGVSLRLITLGLPVADTEDISPGECMLLPMMPLAMVNPVIISFGSEKTICEEGCLSVPDIYAQVERPSRIIIQAEILHHGPVTVECGGLLARCLQHEIDHLNGKLFVERVEAETMTEVKPQLVKLFDFGQKNNFQRSKR